MNQELDTNFQQEFNDLPPGWIVLMETSVEKAMETSLSAMRYLIDEKNFVGIVLSASRPFKNLLQVYQQKKIDTSRMLFIDTVSKSQSMNLDEEGNVLFLESASDLTTISIAIKGSMDKIQGDKFVFIDSITTMLIHNEPAVFAKFIHGILTKMRISGTSGLLISLDKDTDNEVRAEIAQLCDKILRM